MPPGPHPPLQFILDDTNWLSYPQLQQSAEYQQHCESLSWKGLFTEQLAALASGAIRVDLVRQGTILDMPDMNRRDVRIHVGDSLAAIASTLISEQVLQSEFWLNTLGNQPIGEMLEKKLGARRTNIRYAVLPSHSELFANFPGESALWARRYRYQFDSGDLSITEIIPDSIVQRLFNGAGG